MSPNRTIDLSESAEMSKAQILLRESASRHHPDVYGPSIEKNSRPNSVQGGTAMRSIM